MTPEAILGALPMAVGVAISPVPIAAVIVVLMTGGARSHAPAFLAGWMLGILAIGIAVFLIPYSQISAGEPTTIAGVIRIVLGATLLILSMRQWRERPAPDEPVETPKLLARLEGIGAGQALMTGILLSSVNPKNLVLVAAGAAAIDQAVPTLGGQVLAFVAFAAIASLSVAAAIASYALAGEQAEAIFSRWKDTLVRHNTTIVALLLLAVAALLIVRGLKILVA